jgi:hypothetical protein
VGMETLIFRSTNPSRKIFADLSASAITYCAQGGSECVCKWHKAFPGQRFQAGTLISRRLNVDHKQILQSFETNSLASLRKRGAYPFRKNIIGEIVNKKKPRFRRGLRNYLLLLSLILAFLPRSFLR